MNEALMPAPLGSGLRPRGHEVNAKGKHSLCVYHLCVMGQKVGEIVANWVTQEKKYKYFEVLARRRLDPHTIVLLVKLPADDLAAALKLFPGSVSVYYEECRSETGLACIACHELGFANIK